MLAEDIDFYQVFKIHPTGMLLLTADLEIVDANEEFLEQTGRDLEKLLGHHLFEEFPKVPETSSGHECWSAVEAAQASGRREHNVLFRQDIEDREHPGVYVEHFWSSVAQPIRGREGHVEVIEFSLRDVTPIIDEYRVLQSEEHELVRPRVQSRAHAHVGGPDCRALYPIG
jgi:PAS domain-containing protein